MGARQGRDLASLPQRAHTHTHTLSLSLSLSLPTSPYSHILTCLPQSHTHTTHNTYTHSPSSHIFTHTPPSHTQTHTHKTYTHMQSHTARFRACNTASPVQPDLRFCCPLPMPPSQACPAFPTSASLTRWSQLCWEVNGILWHWR